MDENIFKKDHIIFDETSRTQEEAFNSIAELAAKLGYVTSTETFFRDLKEREETSTTGFKDGIAIPHGKSNDVQNSGVFVAKYSNPIEWDSLDGKPVEVAIALTIPEEGSKDHLKILSRISRKLLDKNFVSNLKNSLDSSEVYQIVNEIE